MIKTQFSDIVKIKKNNLHQLELALQKELSQIAEWEEKISQIEQDILNIQYPYEGNFAAYQQMKVAMHNMKKEIETYREYIRSARLRISDIQHKMKLANMEVEKYKYLEQKEILKVLEAKKRKESLELDEVAIMLYNAKKDNE